MAQHRKNYGKNQLEETQLDVKTLERLERDMSKRSRKESIKNARKRQQIFSCRGL